MKEEKVKVLTFLPGQKVRAQTMTQELGVAVDYAANSSVMILGAPSSFVKGKRVGFWTTEFPFVGRFGGDGESIDFSAGPANDFRTDWGVEYPNEDDEQYDIQLRTEAQKAYDGLDDKAGTRALLRAYEEHAGQGMGQRLLTLAFIAVGFVMVLTFMSYMETRGGIGNIFGTQEVVDDRGAF